MIPIPAGDFQMGCDASHDTCYSWERPLHTVTLNAYSIDKYEVTNARYKACVDAGGCLVPERVDSNTRNPYYGTTTYADYPVINVNWFQAVDFCTWAGKRLPTEAEWEKAARGSDTRGYPWGDGEPDCTMMNYLQYDGSSYHMCVGDTSKAGAYPGNASPYGVMDMAGNVWEWVNDYFQGDYYSVSPGNNPTGPVTGNSRVMRGGAWDHYGRDARTAYRNYSSLDTSYDNRGFRCVRSQ